MSAIKFKRAFSFRVLNLKLSEPYTQRERERRGDYERQMQNKISIQIKCSPSMKISRNILIQNKNETIKCHQTAPFEVHVVRCRCWRWNRARDRPFVPRFFLYCSAICFVHGIRFIFSEFVFFFFQNKNSTHFVFI